MPNECQVVLCIFVVHAGRLCANDCPLHEEGRGIQLAFEEQDIAQAIQGAVVERIAEQRNEEEMVIL